MGTILTIAAVVGMTVGLLAIPLGLPGLWAIVVLVLALVLAGSLTWTFGLVVAGAAAVAEVAELLVLRWFGQRFGGSRLAFWGAVAGGMVGLFIGAPVPVVGPLVTAFVGTFLGAGAATLWETGSLSASTRVGWGLVLARTFAIGLKVATAVLVVGAVVLSLWVGR